MQHSITSTTIIYEQKMKNLAKAMEKNITTQYAHQTRINNKGNETIFKLQTIKIAKKV